MKLNFDDYLKCMTIFLDNQLNNNSPKFKLDVTIT